MNDILCDHISRSCFCTKDKGYRLRWFFATLNLQIFADDVYMDGTISTNVTVRSVARQKRVANGGDLTFLSTQIRSVVKNPSDSSDRIGLSFRDGVVGTTTWDIRGSVGMTATCVSDGGEPVARLDVQNGAINVIGNFGVHAGMWVVWGPTISIRNNA